MADGPAWAIEKLAKRHNRDAFSCGVPELDEYLRRYARQNERAGISQHFVAVPAAGDSQILGYYALSAGSVAFDALPADLANILVFSSEGECRRSGRNP